MPPGYFRAGQFLSYSADYPGEMRRCVEQEMGRQNSMAFFLQGGAGDINPIRIRLLLSKMPRR